MGGGGGPPPGGGGGGGPPIPGIGGGGGPPIPGIGGGGGPPIPGIGGGGGPPIPGIGGGGGPPIPGIGGGGGALRALETVDTAVGSSLPEDEPVWPSFIASLAKASSFSAKASSSCFFSCSYTGPSASVGLSTRTNRIEEVYTGQKN